MAYTLRQKARAAGIFVVLALLLASYHLRTIRLAYLPYVAVTANSATLCDGFRASSVPRPVDIPNLVHYVWILEDPTVLRLDFKFFITVYSSHLYFQPDVIYLHTDASPEVFEQAKESGDEWTRRVLMIPNITYHQVVPLSSTNRDVPVEKLEHKADFLRIEALQRYGGIYLDSDAFPIRDISDLRRSGFANIVGRATSLKMEFSGKINNGVLMSVPRSTFVEVFLRASHERFDGGWVTASVLLLTDLANRAASVPHEILILHAAAFAPISWEIADQERLFKPDMSTPVLNITPSQDPKSCKDSYYWLKDNDEYMMDDLEIDFSSSYIIHAFDDEISKMDGFTVDLHYVLAQRSNYARAVYPAIAHAIEAGLVEGRHL